MNQQPMMQQAKPAVAKWLWILLIIVAVLGAAFFAWYYFMGPGKKATATTTTTDKTAGWKTYTNATDGFSFKYPSDWTSAKDLKYFKSAVVGFADPATTTKITSAQTANPGVTPTIFSDIVVAYYSAVTDMTGSPASLTAALSDTIHYKSFTPTTLASLTAYDTIVVSNPNYYAVFVQSKDNHIYEIEFPNIAAKTNLTDTEKTILTTFKFTTPAATPVSADITCTNDTYGFTYVRPASWGACKVKEAKLTGITDTFYVEIATKDANFAAGDQVQDAGYYSPFAISVYTPAQWAEVEASEGPHDTKITSNNDYVFAWSQANGIPATDFGTKTDDIKTIIASFKLQ